MCGLKEIFEGAGNFFDKKVPVNPTFHLEKIKFNYFSLTFNILIIIKILTHTNHQQYYNKIISKLQYLFIPSEPVVS